MAFADDLLALAQDIANLQSERRQVTLRGAISTAYYALFHLLVSEATLNWARPELRPVLGRLFDHGQIHSASEAKRSALNRYFKGSQRGPERTIAEHLWKVCDTFVQAYQRRIDADYNTGIEITEAEALRMIESVTAAFASWHIIREEPDAQAFLLSMLGKARERKSSIQELS
jgi:uncharacterized protein (UPF0332 family)